MKLVFRAIAVAASLASPAAALALPTPQPPPSVASASCDVHAVDFYGKDVSGVYVTLTLQQVILEDENAQPDVVVAGVTGANGHALVTATVPGGIYGRARCDSVASISHDLPYPDDFTQVTDVDGAELMGTVVLVPRPTATIQFAGGGSADLYQSGDGVYDKPVLIAPPFDPDEPIRGPKTPGQQWVQYNGNPTWIGQGGMLKRMYDKHFDVWLFRPKSTGDNIFDQATDFALATRIASDWHTFTGKTVVAGYSMGGLVVRAAMSRWMWDASWRAQYNFDPTPPVNLIAVLDSPLRGALVNTDLQHAFWNASFNDNGRAAYEHNMDSCAAQQMLENACHKTVNGTGDQLECNDRGWYETFFGGHTFSYCNPFNSSGCFPNTVGTGVKTCAVPGPIIAQANGGWPPGIKKIAASLGHFGERTGRCYGDTPGDLRDKRGNGSDGCPGVGAETFDYVFTAAGVLYPEWGFLSLTGTDRHFQYKIWDANPGSSRHHVVDELTPGSRQQASIDDLTREFGPFQTMSGHQTRHMGTYIPLYSALDMEPAVGTIPFDEYWTNSFSGFHDALTSIQGTAVDQHTGATRPVALVEWVVDEIDEAFGATPGGTGGGCGEPSCVPAQGAYISHFTGPGCTGTESYYLPYDGFAFACRPWDGAGQCGTIHRTVTNVSAKVGGDACVDAWPSGNTLSDFVTVYRGGGTTPATFALSVTVQGTGTGTVTSSPAGIDCGAACTVSYATGALVTLSASPAAGSRFVGWSGAGCSGTGDCHVTLSAARAVVATFNDIAAAPSCGEATCVPAQAAYVSHFTGPDCTGTESYYLPYDGFAFSCRSWDGAGACGTIHRTVTNVSFNVGGECTNAWPSGNTLSDFVTVYRGGGTSTGELQPQSVEVTPRAVSTTTGQAVQYVATASFADGTSQSTAQRGSLSPVWRSTNTDVATVDRNGVATTIAPGRAQIVAEFGSVSCEASSACADLTVSAVNTPQGDNVVVLPTDTGTGAAPVELMFDHVDTPGITTVLDSPDGPPIPDGYAFGGTYHNVTTTSAFTGTVTVCASYDGMDADPNNVRLLHYHGAEWSDVTVGLNAEARYVCGFTDSLSPFAVVAIVDAIPPAIGTAPNVTVEAASAGGARVSFELPAVTDNVDGSPAVLAVPASGSMFPLGATTVTITATDRLGNVSTKTFTVTVADRTAPVVQRVTASRTTLWPPNNKMVAVGVTVGAADLVTASPVCRIAGVTSNETGSGQWQITGALSLNLMAARKGSGDGRVYTIAVTCTDAAGNMSPPATTTVVVPHDRGSH